MPSQTLYQIDAFADRLFAGNPAAIIPLKSWWPDELMQRVAEENNLSETAYIVPNDGGYDLRWFTPVFEVKLCGHATLAAAFVVFTELQPLLDSVSFQTKSGTLTVRHASDQNRNQLCMNFPAIRSEPIAVPDGIAEALGCQVVAASAARELDYLIEVESETVVRSLKPDFTALRAFKQARGIIVTARGANCDVVSRYFAPNAGIDEDPVTGSAHCALAPYWSERLGKSELSAQQLSSRGGALTCRIEGQRVDLSGSAVKFLEGRIFVDEARSHA